MYSIIKSGMASAMHELSVISNNVSNANSNGFKKSLVSFADFAGGLLNPSFENDDPSNTDAWGDPLPPKKKGERFFDSVDPLYDDFWGNDKGKEGYVYLIQDIRSGLYKIGITKNMEKRI